MKQEKISISKGNMKVGRVPSVSLLPIVTCAARVPCSIVPDGKKRAPCYVAGYIAARPVVRAAYARNTRILKRTPADFFRQLHAFIERTRPEFFRFHIAGDFTSAAHLRRAFGTAAAFPSVRFLAFSKRYELFPVPSAVPVNFSLIASMWPGYGKRPRGYRCAFMQDGTETRVTPDAVPCPGNCETCAMCWALPRLGCDVVFSKH